MIFRIIPGVLIFFIILFTIYYYPIKRFSIIFKKIKKPLRFSLLYILLTVTTFFIHRKFNTTSTYLIKSVVSQFTGFIFIMFSVTFILDLIKVIFRINLKIFRLLYIISTIIAISVGVFYGNKIFINKFDIKSDKINQNIRIAHLTDIHLGSRSAFFLKKVIKTLKKEKPDIILITGDLIDDEFVDKEFLEAFENIDVPIIFSFGNHETYYGKLKAQKLIIERNISILEQDKMNIMGIDIIGLSDNYDNVNELIKKIKIDNDKFNILMNHQTVSWKGIVDNNIDLTLSGHTHGGQIFPFNYLVKLRYPMINGFYKNKNSIVYVGYGTGTWGPSLRFGTKNEITIFNLSK